MISPLTRIAVCALLLSALTGTGAAKVLAVATRTIDINATNTAFVAIPLRDSGATKLVFKTTKPNETVIFTYNAECTKLSADGFVALRIVVDGVTANPDVGDNFAFCTDDGEFFGVVRQSYLKIAKAGNHTVRVQAAARGGSTGYNLDDASLVVWTANGLAVASRTVDVAKQNTEFEEVPLKDNNVSTLQFSTVRRNETVIFTYNAECLNDAGDGVGYVALRILVDGLTTNPDDGDNFSLCSHSSDFLGTVRQSYLKIPKAGSHTVRVQAAARAGSDDYNLDDASFVVSNPNVLAVASRTIDVTRSNKEFANVRLTDSGDTSLKFKTTKPNETVIFTYNAECHNETSDGFVALRIVVDGVTAEPDVGDNFSLCSRGGSEFFGVVRQSYLKIPKAGNHTVRVQAAARAGSTGYNLDDASLVVWN